MTTPDYRALCAELLQPLAEYDGANPYHEHRALITRARTALAQPEPEFTDDEVDMIQAPWSYLTPPHPEPEGPTDKEIIGCMYKGAASLSGLEPTWIARNTAECVAGVRVALARWGRPAIEPIMGAEWQPIETAPRGVRVLVRLPRETNPITIAEADEDDGNWWEWGDSESDLEDLPTHWQPLEALWGRPALKPVPVSERPILKRDPFNDNQGRCWCGTKACVDRTGDVDVEIPPSWELREPCAQDDVLLPHYALPVPEVTP